MQSRTVCRGAVLVAAAVAMVASPAASAPAEPPSRSPAQLHVEPDQPRIVNYINFIRGVEPRNPYLDLLEPVQKQIQLAQQNHVPVTFLLQYDALLQTRFTDLLRPLESDSFEIGGWLEIVQPLVERSGLAWHGRYPWDWYANVGVTVAYTPEQRERLVDTYMRDFKAIFGRYPRSMGAWILDAHTLGYLADHYGVFASCNVREQIATDGYTVWGGYWNQAYYPSRKNVLVPAQHSENQIPIVLFRMLGNDPIDSYGFPGCLTLEPACYEGGGNPDWVRWYFDVLVNGPSLAFAYTQTGQENAFGWSRMAAGLNDQIPYIAELAQAGLIRVETLEASAQWFRSRFEFTPATAMAATTDHYGRARSSIWYDSRYYRVNLMAENAGLRVRDLHLFDEQYPEPYAERPNTSIACDFQTLPVIDQAIGPGGMLPVSLEGGARQPLTGESPLVSEQGPAGLHVRWPIAPGDTLHIRCRPKLMQIWRAGPSNMGSWGLEMPVWATASGVQIEEPTARTLVFRKNGFGYAVRCPFGRFTRVQNPDGILLTPLGNRIDLDLDTGAPVGATRPRVLALEDPLGEVQAPVDWDSGEPAGIERSNGWTLALHPPRPNPTSSRTVLHFETPAPGPVRLDVLDVQGRRLRSVLETVLPAGNHTAELDPASPEAKLAPGLYLVRLVADRAIRTTKLILLP